MGGREKQKICPEVFYDLLAPERTIFDIRNNSRYLLLQTDSTPSVRHSCVEFGMTRRMVDLQWVIRRRIQGRTAPLHITIALPYQS